MPHYVPLQTVVSAPIPTRFPIKIAALCPPPEGHVLKKLSLSELAFHGEWGERYQVSALPALRYFNQKLSFKTLPFPESHWGYVGRWCLSEEAREVGGVSDVALSLHYDPSSDLLDGTLTLIAAPIKGDSGLYEGELYITLMAHYGRPD